MKKPLALFLVVSLLMLCACSAKPVPTTTTPPTTVPSTRAPAPTAPPTTVPPTTLPPTTVAEVRFRHPLTGEPLEAPFTGRSVAVATNNAAAAQPQHGISQADILYEIMTEGGGYVTRCLAVYTTLADVPKIGAIRSARTYLVNLARCHNAPLVHCGGSPYALNLLAELGREDLDQMKNGDFFYRDAYRANHGYATEHTLFTSGQDLLNCMDKHGFAATSEYPIVPIFSEDATPKDGKTAKTITVRFNKGGKRTVLTFDEKTGVYTGLQKWSNKDHPFEDANNDQAVPFTNVLALYAATSYIGDHVFYEMTGSGEGYFACGGKLIPIRWHRDSLDAPFRYTQEDGTPLTLGVGKSYIAVLPLGSPVTYE